MPIELKMPALSPTMEEGTLAKWLVKEGDTVASGDILAEIETDKATMEFEAVDEGTIAKILVPEGTDGVKVGTAIAMIAGEGEDASALPAPAPKAEAAPPPKAEEPKRRAAAPAKAAARPRPPAGPCSPRRRAEAATGSRRARSPAAWPRRRGSTLPALNGSGPGGRIVKADLGDGRQAARWPRRRRPRPPPAGAAAGRGRAGVHRRRYPARGGQALATCARRSRAA